MKWHAAEGTHRGQDDDGVCVNAYTGVIGQGGLVRVALLFESHVPQLQHGRHQLQQA